MEIEQWPIDRPIPYVRNPRANDASVETVAASIKEFGFQQPIVVDAEGVIIVGHTRLKAAQRLGLDSVPVHVAKTLTEPQARAYRVMDNRAGHASEWDTELLALEIEDLRLDGFDVDLTGFSADELAGLMDDDTPQEQEPDSSTKEIDPDDYQLGHKCPRCGFEFDSDND